MDDLLRYPGRRISFGNFTADSSYAPTFPRFDRYIDAFHADLYKNTPDGSLVDLGITGWLLREDAMKLYELAYYSSGDILEFGTHHGLSTYIIARAIMQTGATREIVSMEIGRDNIIAAKKALLSRGVLHLADIRAGDADRTCENLISDKRIFNFVFVDHSHDYQPMRDACDRLSRLVAPGGLVLFHDYKDDRNRPPSPNSDPNQVYGVLAAIQERLPRDFEFIGCFGCAGLFQRRSQPPVSAA